MKKHITGFSVLLVLVSATVLFVCLKLFRPEQQVTEAIPRFYPDETPFSKEQILSERVEDDDIESSVPLGVNLEFYDTPEIQIGWMQRAKTVIDNNLPGYATSAEVKGSFFHRGFKDWAVTCGEVRFFRDGELVSDYQRFVFPGVQTIYYENDIKNFPIYWEKACIEKSE